MGLRYQLSDTVELIAGAHRGFTAPTNAEGVRPEEAMNFEFGFQWSTGAGALEVIGFLSDYDNILGQCTSSSGNDCEAGDAFNGDAATIGGRGNTLDDDLGSYTIPSIWNPVLVYTYTQGEFDSDIADADFFGNVRAGQSLPYISKNQIAWSLVAEHAALGS